MTIEQLFDPLAKRLMEIENQLENYYTLDYYEHLMFGIEGSLDSYPIDKSVGILTYYKSRVEQIIANLTSKYPEESKEPLEDSRLVSVFEEKKTPKKPHKANLNRRVLNEFLELDHFKGRLDYLLSIREGIKIGGRELPDSFTLDDVKGDFDPKLDTRVAAFFLFYLQKCGYMPLYGPKSTGKLAMLLFGKSENKVVQYKNEAKADVKTSPQKLKELLEFLRTIEIEIEKDLQPNKKITG